MSLIGFGVVFALVSAFTQAVAHALLKSGRDKLIVRALIGATGLAVMAPAAVIFRIWPEADVWPWLIASGLLHVTYQLVLIRAYDAADFSLAYPMARGVAPLGVAGLSLVFLGDSLTALALAGATVVAAGLMSIALDPHARLRAHLWALLAGAFTVTYTLVDAQGVRVADQAVSFIVWFFIVDGLGILAVTLARRGGGLVAGLLREWRIGVPAGLASLATYSTAFLALRALPAGGVSALRETSVVFGALIAAFILRERVGPRRAFGAVAVAFGGAMVVWGLAGTGLRPQ